MVAGGGQGVDALLGRGLVGGREGHGLGLRVANALDPVDILQRRPHALDAGGAAEMNTLDLDLGLGQSGRARMPAVLSTIRPIGRRLIVRT